MRLEERRKMIYQISEYELNHIANLPNPIEYIENQMESCVEMSFYSPCFDYIYHPERLNALNRLRSDYIGKNERVKSMDKKVKDCATERVMQARIYLLEIKDTLNRVSMPPRKIEMLRALYQFLALDPEITAVSTNDKTLIDHVTLFEVPVVAVDYDFYWDREECVRGWRIIF